MIFAIQEDRIVGITGFLAREGGFERHGLATAL
jgi:hypothetical protein